jgi:hypothetical protein
MQYNDLDDNLISHNTVTDVSVYLGQFGLELLHCGLLIALIALPRAFQLHSVVEAMYQKRKFQSRLPTE